MPISISSSAMVKVGRPACGTVHGVSAAPMERHGVGRLLRDARHLVEIGAGLSRGAGDLVGIHHAGDAAPLLGLRRRRAGDVVGEQHRGGTHVLHLQHVAGHVEVHHVAAVVAVEAQHAGAAIGRAHRLRHLLHRGRGEHVADGAGVEQALADIAGEDRQMAGAAAGDDADLALPRRARALDDAAAVAGALVVLRVRQDQALEHLLDIELRDR